MTRELRFPRRIKREHVSFRLVLTRKIPDHPQAAIYRSAPIFSKGKLVEDYLILGPGGLMLGQTHTLADALKRMFLLQPSLRQKRPRPPRPAHSA